MKVTQLLPIRPSNTEILHDWFNTIRLVLLQIMGQGAILVESFDILDGQATPQSLTGFVFDSSEVNSAILEYEITRGDRAQWGQVRFSHKGGDWLKGELVQSGQYAGVEFSMTSGGQLQYVSDAYAEGLLTIKTLSTIRAVS